MATETFFISTKIVSHQLHCFSLYIQELVDKAFNWIVLQTRAILCDILHPWVVKQKVETHFLSSGFTSLCIEKKKRFKQTK